MCAVTGPHWWQILINRLALQETCSTLDRTANRYWSSLEHRRKLSREHRIGDETSMKKQTLRFPISDSMTEIGNKTEIRHIRTLAAPSTSQDSDVIEIHLHSRHDFALWRKRGYKQINYAPYLDRSCSQKCWNSRKRPSSIAILRTLRSIVGMLLSLQSNWNAFATCTR